MYIDFTFENQLNRSLPTLMTSEQPENTRTVKMKITKTSLFKKKSEYFLIKFELCLKIK